MNNLKIDSTGDVVGKDLVAFLSKMNRLTGLVHDIGKSFYYFQNKISLNPDDIKPIKELFGGDPVRHEKLSYDVISQILNISNENYIVESLLQAKRNFKGFSLEDFKGSNESIALISSRKSHFLSPILHLTLSHHKLVTDANSLTQSYENQRKHRCVDETKIFSTFKGQPFILDSLLIQAEIEGTIDALINIYETSDNKEFLSATLKDKTLLSQITQFVLRPAFIVADQYFSSKDCSADKSIDQSKTSVANKVSNLEGEQYNQTLEEHLLGVARQAEETATYFLNHSFYLKGMLRTIKKSPTMLDKTPSILSDKFGWQDKCIESIESTIPKEGSYGFLGIVMAETGSGKTIGNAKILSAACHHKDLRFTCLLGMRSLTLQTFDEYQAFLGFSQDVVGVIGSAHTLELHDKNKSMSVLDEAIMDEPFTQVTGKKATGFEQPFMSFSERESNLSKIIDAPVSVCTIDYMVAGFSAERSNKAKNLIRLMDSDLIIDEVDSYNNQQLASILKLVYLSAFYGNKVIVSSATTPQRMITSIQDAYKEGYQRYCKLHNKSPVIYGGLYTHSKEHIQTGLLENIDTPAFVKSFKNYITAHSQKLTLGVLTINKSVSLKSVFNAVAHKAFELSDSLSNQVDTISFCTGLVKLANVKHVIAFANEFLEGNLDGLIPEDTLLKIETYHSKNFEIKKSFQEQQLKPLLTRKSDIKLMQTSQFKALQKEAFEKGFKKVVVLVVGSPIIETGRDFDFDWVINEPRDHRSIIQAAGRNYRHRNYSPKHCNFWVLPRSLRAHEQHYSTSEKACLYSMPGFEDEVSKIDARVNLDFSNLFEFVQNDFINASKTIDSTYSNYAKECEVEGLEQCLTHSHSFDNFLSNLRFTYTREQADVLPFRSTSGTESELDYIKGLNGKGRLELKALSSQSALISFNHNNKPKRFDLIFCQKTLSEIISDHYGYDIEDYVKTPRLISHSETSASYSEYTGSI